VAVNEVNQAPRCRHHYFTLLCFAPLLGLLFFSGTKEARPLNKSQASVTCLKGRCLLLPQESLYFITLTPLTPTLAFEGDQAVTLDKNSEIEITFPDQSKLIQRNTALIKIQKGRESLLRNINKDTENFNSSDPSQKEKIQEHSIIYVGDLPLEVLQPKPGTEIISSTRPMNLRIVIRTGTKLSASTKDESLDIVWQVYQVDNATGETKLNPLSTFKFETTSDESIKEAIIQLTENGKYLFAPKSLDPRIGANGFQLSLSTDSELSEKISDLIDNYDDRKDQPIEIRSQ